MVQSNEITIKHRNSSIELLRIIAMLIIVFHHFAVHWWFDFWNIITVPRLRYNFIAIWWKIGVDVFVLISWYFLITNKDWLDIKRILKLYLQIFFYSVTLLIIFMMAWNYSFDVMDIIKSVIPIRWKNWWFASCYFILYLIHPLLNKIVLKLDKKTYQILMLVWLLCFCVLPTFAPMMWVWWGPLLLFILLYYIAWYIRLYDIPIKIKSSWYLKLFLIAILLTYLSSLVFSFLWTEINRFNNIVFYFYAQDTVTIVWVSVLLFMIFVKMNMKYNKIVNLVASSTFWIYLIHDNFLMRDFLWNDLFENVKYQDTIFLIPYSIFAVSLVFVSCMLIDLFRKKYFEKYYLKVVDSLLPNLHASSHALTSFFLPKWIKCKKKMQVNI